MKHENYFNSLKEVARIILSCLFLLAGTLHFVYPDNFLSIMPPLLPAPIVFVYLSGFFELLGGAGLLIVRFRKIAAYGLIVLLIAVLPANIYMAVENVQVGGILGNPIVQWLRIPFQAVLIAWVYGIKD